MSEDDTDPLAKTWPQAPTAAQVHAIAKQIEQLANQVVQVEDNLTATFRAQTQEILDRLYDLAKLLESHGARHDIIEAASRRHATTIAEMYANSEHTHLRTDATDSRHDLEIVSLQEQIRELAVAVKSAHESDQHRGALVAREARNLKWVMAILVPSMTAIFAAVAEALKLLGR